MQISSLRGRITLTFSWLWNQNTGALVHHALIITVFIWDQRLMEKYFKPNEKTASRHSTAHLAHMSPKWFYISWLYLVRQPKNYAYECFWLSIFNCHPRWQVFLSGGLGVFIPCVPTGKKMKARLSILIVQVYVSYTTLMPGIHFSCCTITENICKARLS